MSLRIIWTEPAEQDMRRLDRTVARRVRQAVLRLAETGHGNVKRRQGQEREWRLRVGQWRVRFTMDVTHSTLYVLPRGRAYR